MPSAIDKLLPQRLRESSFRRFEQTIFEIVEKFPTVVKVHSADLAPLTIAGRLRDAMASLYQYQWRTVVNTDKFRKTYLQIVVSHRGSQVVAGSREAIAQQFASSEPAMTVSAPIDASEVVFDFDYSEVRLVCKLASVSMLAQPLVFREKDDKPFDYVVLEEDFDCRIDKNPDGTYTIS